MHLGGKNDSIMYYISLRTVQYMYGLYLGRIPVVIKDIELCCAVLISLMIIGCAYSEFTSCPPIMNNTISLIVIEFALSGR